MSRIKEIMTHFHISCVMRKLDFCLSENKSAYQLRGNRESGQRLCFRYSDSIIPLLKSKISSFYPSSVIVQASLCQTRSKNPKDQFSHVAAHIVDINYFLFSKDWLFNNLSFGVSPDAREPVRGSEQV